ncbi:hypothetical protein GCM10008015_07260 [Flavobacterium palustre]|uniref:Uncharacterized protein n=1 Tax=Flavobacterium palustre TaxID=1476463 RepID=A0ABQ1HB83_9FLAO|nr:hypothetical protein [Flavobacterium palustre]GGA69052.1 hypothetical protein GCM10008015_07260 [Flavobacterium palustre]
MNYKSKIRLAYRLVIDNSSTFVWDKYVFEDTYQEYLLQHQQFNSKENPQNTFRELLSENEKAVQLHYLVGISADNYVQQLKGNLYRITDILGNNYFPFTNYRFDIINTDITDISKHKIGITFYSPLLTYLGMIDNHFLLSKNTEESNEFETFMIAQANLSVCYLKE